jgi:protein-L-isoaspartate O-methyltransferase
VTTPTGSAQHYEALLAEHYTWMMGGIEACLAKARGLLDATGLAALPRGAKVLDLGCGPGYHARVLAEAGLEVIAVDDSPGCLAELRVLCAGLNVLAIAASLTDLQHFRARAPFDALLCAGDTLPHLADADAVASLIDSTAALLAPGGRLVLEFREQSSNLSGADAVLTTRASRDRIMQCVLHYEPERVQVTDLVHEWTGDAWQTRQSSYFKLRLTGEQLTQLATAAGLQLVLDTMRAGQRTLVYASA